MRRLLAGLGACVLALAACGTDAHPPSAACTGGPGTLLVALRGAPATVTLGGRPISSCFTKGSDAADVQAVGSSWVTVASELATEARHRPEGEAALRLGYLVGAAARGARNSPGLHAELVRRLRQEALPLEPGSDAFRRGVRAGERVG